MYIQEHLTQKTRHGATTMHCFMHVRVGVPVRMGSVHAFIYVLWVCECAGVYKGKRVSPQARLRRMTAGLVIMPNESASDVDSASGPARCFGRSNHQTRVHTQVQMYPTGRT